MQSICQRIKIASRSILTDPQEGHGNAYALVGTEIAETPSLTRRSFVTMAYAL